MEGQHHELRRPGPNVGHDHERDPGGDDHEAGREVGQTKSHGLVDGEGVEDEAEDRTDQEDGEHGAGAQVSAQHHADEHERDAQTRGGERLVERVEVEVEGDGQRLVVIAQSRPPEGLVDVGDAPAR